MSRHYSDIASFKCASDCQQTGCPGHRLRIVYMTTSDHVVIEIDPDETKRPGDNVWNHVFDENAFDVMVDLAIADREKWLAAAEPPRETE